MISRLVRVAITICERLRGFGEPLDVWILYWLKQAGLRPTQAMMPSMASTILAGVQQALCVVGACDSDLCGQLQVRAIERHFDIE
jgi:hypothetical protein